MSNETYPFTFSVTEDECECLQHIMSQRIQYYTDHEALGHTLTEQERKALSICEGFYAKIS